MLQQTARLSSGSEVVPEEPLEDDGVEDLQPVKLTEAPREGTNQYVLEVRREAAAGAASAAAGCSGQHRDSEPLPNACVENRLCQCVKDDAWNCIL